MSARDKAGLGIPGLSAYSRGTSATASGCGPLTTSCSDPAGPQLPSASRPRTHSRCTPGLKLDVVRVAVTATVARPNVPVMGWPRPGAAAISPNDHSAESTAAPPVPASVIVAVAIAGFWLSMGFGVALIDPATTRGPDTSPPARLIVNDVLLAPV